MASSVFLDANGWVALLNSADNLYAQADHVWRETVTSGRRIVLTDWIVAETGNGLARVREKGRLRDALNLIVSSTRGELVFIDDELLRRSLDYYGRHADKSWGLVDCTSFLVMRDREIAEAFTGDRHYEQAGFQCLLSP